MFLFGAMDQQVIHYSDKLRLLVQIVKDHCYIVHPDLGGTHDPHREYFVVIYRTPKIGEDPTKFLAAFGQGNAMVHIFQITAGKAFAFRIP